jgi:hypothetical protein
MPKKPKRKAVVPRLGPPTNLRPAGAHKDKRAKTRTEVERAALSDEAAFERSERTQRPDADM